MRKSLWSRPRISPLQCNRQFLNSRVLGTRSLVSKVPSLTLDAHHNEHDNLTQAFREQAWVPKAPVLLPRHLPGSPAALLPAAEKWFTTTAAKDEGNARIRNADAGLHHRHGTPARTLAPYLDEFEDWPFPYELVVASADKQEALAAMRDWLLKSEAFADQMLAGILQPAIAEMGEHRRFFQIHAPLRLLTRTLAFNARQQQQQQQGQHSNPVELYVAQSSLADLPQALQDDVPAPDLVLRAGKGDVYSSSVWLGTEPTYTPLHRDPNPNLFCQLCGGKTVRVMPPALGDRLFFEVQVKLRQAQSSVGGGGGRIRSTEMMEGEEREVLHGAVWENEELPGEVCEAEVGPGDALFIPQGWWHSVKSIGSEGHLNGSVNWWFR